MIEYRLSTNIGNVSELSTRLKHGLNRLRLETINDVLLVEISSVSSLPYIGRRCIDELIAFKERYDFLLKKDKCNDNKEEQEFQLMIHVVSGILSNESLMKMIIENANKKCVSVDEEIALNVKELTKELLKEYGQK